MRLALVVVLTAPLAWAAAPVGVGRSSLLGGESQARIQNLEQDLADWQLAKARVEMVELKKLNASEFSGRLKDCIDSAGRRNSLHA